LVYSYWNFNTCNNFYEIKELNDFEYPTLQRNGSLNVIIFWADWASSARKALNELSNITYQFPDVNLKERHFRLLLQLKILR
jgi:hypothetical protein